jgi:hypothetical protein
MPNNTATLRRGLAAAAALVGLGALAACADAPSAPAGPAPRAAARGKGDDAPAPSGTLTLTQALLRTQPLAQPVVVTKKLGRAGGGITVPGTDFSLQVPNGALPRDTMTFTITAYPGNAVAYDFQPHGTVFLKPLKAVQQLGHTNWKSFGLGAGTYAAGGYFADVSQIDLTTGKAYINEFMPGEVTVGGATMTWDIPHFSGYTVVADRGSRIAY